MAKNGAAAYSFVVKVAHFYGEGFRSGAESVLSNYTVTAEDDDRLFWCIGPDGGAGLL